MQLHRVLSIQIAIRFSCSPQEVRELPISIRYNLIATEY